jgi:two-component system chemotaxis response regulator CheB
VLVVDDSALVRTVLAEMLGQQPDMVVQIASDPLIALEKMKRFRPHVIVMDLEMPRMDGLTFLRKIMADDPIPVVVCSGHAEEGSAVAFEAIAHGAVEIVTKPHVGVSEFLRDAEILIVDAVRSAAEARIGRRRRESAATPAPRTSVKRTGTRALVSDPVVALGASIGGTEALERVLGALPEGAPPVLVVQHMPAPFTASFAHRLDALCKIEVREARQGDALHWGLALVAPGNRHLSLVRGPDGLLVDITEGDLVSRHRPSVDVLFHSVARVAGPHGIGVILTGMGVDGAAGLSEMRSRGARTLAQDEATSVVFGMPRAAIARGAAERVLPLDQIADAVLELAPARR